MALAVVLVVVCTPARAALDLEGPEVLTAPPMDGGSADAADIDLQPITVAPYETSAEPFALNLPAPGQLDIDLHAVQKLRAKWRIDAKIAHCTSDLEAISVLSAWVHGLWLHDPWNVPDNPDPVWIVKAAARGARFRCQEYALVLSSALNAVGIPARMLSLMRADVAVAEFGAAHVAVEAYLRRERRWVFVDPQWDGIITRYEQPVNAAELRQALIAGEHDILRVHSGSGNADASYLAWIRPYLTFLSVPLYIRSQPPPEMPTRIMLAPAGADAPTVFQRSKPLGRMVVLHSPVAFYQPPAQFTSPWRTASRSSPAMPANQRTGS